MPKRMVGLECVLAPLAAPFPRRSASEEDDVDVNVDDIDDHHRDERDEDSFDLI